jgi:hypothetical protein
MSYNGMGIVIIGGKEKLFSSGRLATMRNAQVFGAVAPVVPTAPCSDPGRFRSPVDQACACPPGTHVTPEAGKYDCLPDAITGRSFYFPDCKDAAGNKVPNCFMGFPLKSTAVTLGAGAVLGLVLSALLRG